MGFSPEWAASAVTDRRYRSQQCAYQWPFPALQGALTFEHGCNKLGTATRRPSHALTFGHRCDRGSVKMIPNAQAKHDLHGKFHDSNISNFQVNTKFNPKFWSNPIILPGK
jgi:hypothetical protein